MSISFYIARRYLFSKKRLGVINIISAIAVGGIALATMAMVCTLSVFNGFHDLLGSLYSHIDPQILVQPVRGKYFSTDDAVVERLRQHPAVAATAEVVSDEALILFQGHPLVVQIKGVDDQYQRVTAIDSVLYGQGTFCLENAGLCYGIPGIGLAQQMGGPDYGTLQVCAPRGGERINLANPIESFSVEDLQSAGLVFSVSQRKYDDHLILTSIDFARRLFEKEGLATALEVRLRPEADEAEAKAALRQIAGERFTVKDRLEQQDDIFSIMSIEKLIAYIFLTFIVLVACFNIISALSMLIIEKQADIRTLRYMGMSDNALRRVFLAEGRMISLLGAVVGIVVGVGLCLLQQHFGLIQLGSTGSFIIDTYPVSVHLVDILVVFATVIFVGYLAVWYPVSYILRSQREAD